MFSKIYAQFQGLRHTLKMRNGGGLIWPCSNSHFIFLNEIDALPTRGKMYFEESINCEVFYFKQFD